MTSRSAAGLAEVRHAIESAAERVSALIRSASDITLPVPRSEWTAAETAAHLTVVCGVYTEALSREEVRWMAPYLSGPERTRDRLAEGNARALALVAERDAAGLAEELDAGAGALMEALRGRSPHTPVSTPWYGEGQSRDLHTLACVGLGELLVHGGDIARALRRPWPIDATHARLVLGGAASMIPHYVNPATATGMAATYMVHVRGGSSFVVHFEAGGATVDTAAQRVDCHLSVDPVAFLLVGYGRVSQWGPIATGKLVAWGRKPWLGFRFKSLLLNP